MSSVLVDRPARQHVSNNPSTTQVYDQDEAIRNELTRLAAERTARMHQEAISAYHEDPSLLDSIPPSIDDEIEMCYALRDADSLPIEEQIELAYAQHGLTTFAEKLLSALFASYNCISEDIPDTIEETPELPPAAIIAPRIVVLPQMLRRRRQRREIAHKKNTAKAYKAKVAKGKEDPIPTRKRPEKVCKSLEKSMCIAQVLLKSDAAQRIREPGRSHELHALNTLMRAKASESIVRSRKGLSKKKTYSHQKIKLSVHADGLPIRYEDGDLTYPGGITIPQQRDSVFDLQVDLAELNGFHIDDERAPADPLLESVT